MLTQGLSRKAAASMRYANFTTVALALVCVALTSPAMAAAPSGETQYDRCLARVPNDPDGALMLANAWAKTDGGAPAGHCAALALVGLRRYAEAAVKLDALAKSGFGTNPSMRTTLYDQAGNAWLLAARPDSALASFTAALAVDPMDADILSDRARANALKQNWAKADSDLTAALLVSPERADLYVLRGSARHAMGHTADARADFNRALQLQPGNADALVERGTAKFEDGDVAGARQDWQAAASAAPGSAAAETARSHLTDTAPPTHP
jgi:tetratricopeptide (TPR) repeat protein